MPEIREIEFPEKDAPLRRDVSWLGALVGDVVRAEEGDALFDAVERARLAAIRRRESAEFSVEAEAELVRTLSGLVPREAEAFIRAFALWFRTTNLAEQVHRVRRRRAWEASGRPGKGTLEEAFAALAAAGRSREEIAALLASIRLEPVFTAHPTEATRRVLLEKMQRIALVLLARLDGPAASDPGDREARRVGRELRAIWQTEEHPEDRPTVADEVEHVLYYLTDILYPLAPSLYEGARRALPAEAGELPVVVRFASWVGGDMDGNPNVDASTIRATLARLREAAVALHRGELARLRGNLTQSRSRVGFSEDVLRRLGAYRLRFPETDASIPSRHRDMPYENLLRFVDRRLAETARGGDGAYVGPAELLEDVRAIEESLAANRGVEAGGDLVRRARRRVETFGFHLAALDVRQDSAVHRRAAAVAEDDPGHEDAAPVLEVFRALAEARSAHGPESLGPAIVSMAREPRDVLDVLFLARRAGLVEADGSVPLDVAPLFETVDDLEAAEKTLGALFENAEYRGHLRRRGNRQVVMVGYSDSNKDGGIAAARFALHAAQGRIVQACEAQGIAPVVFHGRGGTISRGGGNSRRAILASHPGAVRFGLRVTEQGEMIDAKFGMRPIALRTLEQQASAILLALGLPREDDRRAEDWTRRMETIATASRDAYRTLVREDARFVPYFRAATPIDVIERMPIGSRPPSRKAGGGPESLRAIPWVFAWTQSRHLLPGWFGLGTGLEGGVRAHGEAAVAEMAREWPFLAAMLADVEMVLAKTDLSIAERYAGLAGEAERPVFETIAAEYARTRDLVLRLTGRSSLLETEPALARSIRLRNPYVDPMSYLQVDLLSRWRAGGRRDDALFRALQATVRGIAQGLRNTG